jgi:enoyl-CoA hydratase/carnithine racemase
MTIEASTADDVVRLRLSSSDDPWPALAATVRGLRGSTRVLVVRIDGDLVGTDRSATVATPTPARDVADAADAANAAAAAQQAAAANYLRRPDLVSVALVDGPIGAALLGASLACDLRVLSDDASVTVGNAAPQHIFGSLARLAGILGYSRALELCLTGRRMSAAEAGAVGLANLVVAADQLDAAADDLVAALLATPRAAATEMKAVLASSGLDGFDDSAWRRRFDAEREAVVRLVRDDE